ncbi:MAG: cytochrome c oxidase assembly protein [Phycisphaerales bacterium]
MPPGATVPWWPSAWLVLWLLLLSACYLRGFLRLRRRDPGRWARGRAASFLLGCVVLLAALSGWLDAWAEWRLSAHMAQHVLLTMAAPPLLLCGWPGLPLLLGAPAWIRRDLVGAFLGWRPLRRALRTLVRLPVAWLLFTITTLAWHLPAAYQAALERPWLHALEHASFLITAGLFWWPVVAPWPWRRTVRPLLLVPYLLLADLANTLLSATLAFSPTLLYPWYAGRGSVLGADAPADEALRDQGLAGALMWFIGAAAYVVPAAALVVHAMRPRRLAAPQPPAAPRRPVAPRRPAPIRAIPLPQLGTNVPPAPPARGGGAAPAATAAPPRRFDLLNVPLIGPLLRHRAGRLAIRACLLLLAAGVVVDGLLGPREAPMNLAGTLPWTHWRGMAVLGLVAVGNVACMSCPFVLPRMLGRRSWRPRGVAWPRFLRTKWTAVVLVVAWLVCYETFDLWSSPLATALVIAGYFAAAFAVDALFRAGSFCKWVCPLGQFNMLQSTVAPLQVAAVDVTVCERCTTHDCLRGNEHARGCELELFVPRKGGALDCTWCLDCVDACPHGNVGILGASPGRELRRGERRSSLGRLLRRTDVAALALAFSGGAIANAAGMTSPVLDAMAALGRTSGLGRGAAAAAVILALIAAPGVISALAARMQQAFAPGRSTAERWRALALAWVPLGAAMWLVHFAFHLVTSWQSAGPVAVRALGDLGLSDAEPQWSQSCCTQVPVWWPQAALLVLGAGCALSLLTAWRTSGGRLLPWLPGAAAILCGWVACAWVVFQPMDMRGTWGPP